MHLCSDVLVTVLKHGRHGLHQLLDTHHLSTKLTRGREGEGGGRGEGEGREGLRRRLVRDGKKGKWKEEGYSYMYMYVCTHLTPILSTWTQPLTIFGCLLDSPFTSSSYMCTYVYSVLRTMYV